MNPFVLNILLNILPVLNVTCWLYALKLSWQQNPVKPCWADSHVKGFTLFCISESWFSLNHLMMETEVFPEMSVVLSHLMWLSLRKDFSKYVLTTEFCWVYCPPSCNKHFLLLCTVYKLYLGKHAQRKSNLKATRLHAKQAQRGGRGIAVLILDPGARRGWLVIAMPQLLYSQEGDRLSLVQKAGWAS